MCLSDTYAKRLLDRVSGNADPVYDSAADSRFQTFRLPPEPTMHFTLNDVELDTDGISGNRCAEQVARRDSRNV